VTSIAAALVWLWGIQKYTENLKGNLLLHLCVGMVPTPSHWAVEQQLFFFVDHSDLRNKQKIRKPIHCYTCVSEQFRHWQTWYWDSSSSFSLIMVN
jgi:hypothetical protein